MFYYFVKLFQNCKTSTYQLFTIHKSIVHADVVIVACVAYWICYGQSNKSIDIG